MAAESGVCSDRILAELNKVVADAGYSRWKGHDMQTRAYDNTQQGIDRVIRNVLSWEACAMAAAKLNTKALMKALASRQTAKAQNMMRAAVVAAHKYFDRMYKVTSGRAVRRSPLRRSLVKDIGLKMTMLPQEADSTNPGTNPNRAKGLTAF